MSAILLGTGGCGGPVQPAVPATVHESYQKENQPAVLCHENLMAFLIFNEYLADTCYGNWDTVIGLLLSQKFEQCLETSRFITLIKQLQLVETWASGDHFCNETKEFCKTSRFEKCLKLFHRIPGYSVDGE